MRAMVSGQAVAAGTDIHHDHAFHMLLAGSYVSLLGSRVTAIAYPMVVLYLTNSAVTAGLVAFVTMVPTVLIYLPAGALVDRWDPWWTMLISEAGRGCAMASVALAVVIGRAALPVLVVAAMIEQSLEVFSSLGERRFVSSLVPRHRVPSAIVRIEGRTHMALILARPLGGLLFGVRHILPFLSDAFSFAVSVAVLVRIRPAARVRSVCNERVRLIGDICDGARCLLHDAFIRSATILGSITTLAFQALIMIFLADAHARGVAPFEVGVVLAGSGFGGIAGSLVASAFREPGERPWLKVQMCTWCVTFAVLALWGTTSLALVMAVMAVLGFTGALGNIEVSSRIMRTTSGSMLGRVSGIGRLLSFAAYAVGPVLGGSLTNRYGPERAVALLLAVVIAFTSFCLLSPSMLPHKAGVSVGD
jgi:MFS family permease